MTVNVIILSFLNIELCTFTVTDKQKSLRYIYNESFKLIIQVLDSFNGYFSFAFIIKLTFFKIAMF